MTDGWFALMIGRFTPTSGRDGNSVLRPTEMATESVPELVRAAEETVRAGKGALLLRQKCSDMTKQLSGEVEQLSAAGRSCPTLQGGSPTLPSSSPPTAEALRHDKAALHRRQELFEMAKQHSDEVE